MPRRRRWRYTERHCRGAGNRGRKCRRRNRSIQRRGASVDRGDCRIPRSLRPWGVGNTARALDAAMTPLPIDERIPEIVRSARHSPSLLLEAPPGAGKTTRVPRALWEHRAGEGEIIVLQPRRLATRLAARRVAEELGEPLGETVGYQI